MRSRLWLVLIGVSLLMPLPEVAARRATSIVQSTLEGAGNDFVVTISAATAGNRIALVACSQNDTQTITPSDNIDGGTGWTEYVAHVTAAANRGRAFVKTASGGETDITITSSGTASTSGAVLEITGDGGVSDDGDDTDADTATTTHGDNISVSPSSTNETVAFGHTCASAGSTTFSVNPGGDGYTAVTGGPSGTTWAGYKITTATTALAFASTTSANRSTNTILMLIKTSVTSGGGATPCLRSLLGVGC